MFNAVCGCNMQSIMGSNAGGHAHHPEITNLGRAHVVSHATGDETAAELASSSMSKTKQFDNNCA